jgi:hypothetical protein
VVATLAAIAGTTVLPAVTIVSADYFAPQAGNTCTASLVGDKNTWTRIYRYTGCSGYVTFGVRKGLNTYPFGNETHVSNAATGFIEIVDEVASKVSNGQVTDYRVFRDMGTGVKGMPWLPISFNSATGKSWVSNEWIEHWTNAAGNPSCQATQNSYQQEFHSTLDMVTYLGIWPGYVQDKRVGSPNPNAWLDVKVIEKTGIYGSNPQYTENYYYGQVLNPSTGAWEAVGLIKFEVFQNSTLTTSNVNNKLETCSLNILCGSCPP